MDKIERVQAALQGEEMDSVPVSFWYHFPDTQKAGHPMAQAHIAYYRAADPDFLKVMNDNDYVPAGLDHVSRPSDWRRLRPAPLSARHFQDQLIGLQELVASLGDEVLLITTIFNVYSVGNKISGGQLVQHLRTEPDAVIAGLATIAESQAAFARACIEAGAAGIFFSAQGGGVEQMTSAEWRQAIRPHDRIILQAAEDAGATFNLLHICGERLRLEAYSDYPGHAVNWAPQMDNLSLQEGQKLFGRTVVGGIDQRGPIVDGTREQIEEEVRAALAQMGERSFMLGAGCTLPSDISAKHLVWARQAAQRTV